MESKLIEYENKIALLSLEISRYRNSSKKSTPIQMKDS